MSEEMNETMLDLLCKKAVYGLTAQEEKQLAELEARSGGASRSQSFELTAAAIGMTAADTREEMPAHLRSRIIADAERYFSEASRSPVREAIIETAPRRSMFDWLGWAIAAAACVALVLNVYFTRRPQENIPLSQAEMNERMMKSVDSAPDLTRAAWEAGKMPEIAPKGEVTWSDSKQTGYLRISGLPKNDPNRETYQLWIVAENQDPKTPVDGGVFDVNSDGEVIIPINTKVKVQNPQAFAITMEQPGGVVVSKSGKVAAVAKRET